MSQAITTIVLVFALAAHVVSALIYVRALHSERGRVGRMIFVGREIALFVIAMVAFKNAPWVAYVFAAYAAAAAFGRADMANSAPNASLSGAGRLLLRR